MSKGKATGTAASVAALAADAYRDRVTFQMYDATAAVYFGFGEDAVANEGLGLSRIGDTFTVTGELARPAINIIGNGGKVSYQTGAVVSVVSGPVILPAA